MQQTPTLLTLLRRSVLKVSATSLLLCAGAFGQSDYSSTSTSNGQNGGVSAVKLVLTQQADVSGAFALGSKAQRGQYVYNSLTSLAQQTQPAVLQAIEQIGLTGTGYYVANVILVQAPAGQTISSAQLQQLSSRSDIAALETVQAFNTKLPAVTAPAVLALPPGRGIEKNIQFINAPEVWAESGQGQGITVGIVDSGVQWSHPLLRRHYRGVGSANSVSHSYNWWDAVHTTLTSGTNPCGVNSAFPCDDLGHGTHAAGVAVGGNGKDYGIGVAPEAQFIACRSMDRGYATSGTNFEECMQFMLAPWNSQGLNPDPSKAPDVVMNPYHCYNPGSGCIDDPVMHAVYWNLYAAGIVSVVPSEDTGQICGSTTASLPQNYSMSIVAGALDYDTPSGNPALRIAAYSGGGPGSASMIFKPFVAAPGTQILSAALGGNVASSSGTAVAGAHVAGAVALLLGGDSSLRGKPEQIWRLIGTNPAQPVPVGTCGSPVTSPNFLYGWGLLDVDAMSAHIPAN